MVKILKKQKQIFAAILVLCLAVPCIVAASVAGSLNRNPVIRSVPVSTEVTTEEHIAALKRTIAMLKAEEAEMMIASGPQAVAGPIASAIGGSIRSFAKDFIQLFWPGAGMGSQFGLNLLNGSKSGILSRVLSFINRPGGGSNVRPQPQSGLIGGGGPALTNTGGSEDEYEDINGMYGSFGQIIQLADGSYYGNGLMNQMVGYSPMNADGTVQGWFHEKVNNTVISNVEKAIRDAYDPTKGGVPEKQSWRGGNTGISRVADTQPKTLEEYIAAVKAEANKTPARVIDMELVTAVIEIVSECHTCVAAQPPEPAQLCGETKCLVEERNLVLIPALVKAFTETPVNEDGDYAKLLAMLEQMFLDNDAKWQEQIANAMQASGGAGEGGGEGGGGAMDILGQIMEMIMGIIMASQMAGAGGGGGGGNGNQWANPGGPVGADQVPNSLTNDVIKTFEEALQAIELAEKPGTFTRNGEEYVIKAGDGYHKVHRNLFFPQQCSSEAKASGGTLGEGVIDFRCLSKENENKIRAVVDTSGGEKATELIIPKSPDQAKRPPLGNMNTDWCEDTNCSMLGKDRKDRHCLIWHIVECTCSCMFKNSLDVGGDPQWNVDRIQSADGGTIYYPAGHPKGREYEQLKENITEGCTIDAATMHMQAAIACFNARKKFENQPGECCRAVPHRGTAGAVGKEVTTVNYKANTKDGFTHAVDMEGKKFVEITAPGGRFERGTSSQRRSARAAPQGKTPAPNVNLQPRISTPIVGGGGPRLTNIIGSLELPIWELTGTKGSPSGFTIEHEEDGSDWFGRHGMHNPIETQMMFEDWGWVPGETVVLLADSTGRGTESYAQRLSRFLSFYNREDDGSGGTRMIPTTIIAPTSVIRDKGSGYYYPIGGQWLAFTAGGAGVPVDPYNTDTWTWLA